jgi:hypothetical protein
MTDGSTIRGAANERLETADPEEPTQRERRAATDAKGLVDRYVALWMEANRDIRRRIIRELWAPHGTHVLEPPREIRDAASALGFRTPALEARGYEALEARVTRAYEEFIAPGRFVFRSRDNASRLRDVVKFGWEMVPVGGGAVAAVGLEILLLDHQERIEVDYQFIEA